MVKHRLVVTTNSKTSGKLYRLVNAVVFSVIFSRNDVTVSCKRSTIWSNTPSLVLELHDTINQGARNDHHLSTSAELKANSFKPG